MPEWTMRWREVLPKALGLEQGTAKTLMGEMFTKLVYLDTGLAKVPVAQLDEVAAYTGLPWEIAAIDLRGLRSAVESALARLR